MVSRARATSWIRDSAASAGTPVSAAAASSAAADSVLQAVVTGRSSRGIAWRDSDNRYERPPQTLRPKAAFGASDA
ncbi:hypothetical protein, partial [Amycolatopsis lexingtonensis]|uniref:hypothetical protein n=1 Tax=Amycolatopsis lexingtonensis TaxID=218822 RepID=UPI001B80323E